MVRLAAVHSCFPLDGFSRQHIYEVGPSLLRLTAPPLSCSMRPLNGTEAHGWVDAQLMEAVEDVFEQK